ncbi:IclR family transcriptional regulator [Orrella marina]|nr:helix-turn-helix domain-containing protein [Orrella marina]
MSYQRSMPSQATDNRSLVRGLEILRAFRPGIDVLTNSELAERTRLPRSTVSRLTGTLVRAGFLQHDARHGGYRLHATVLGLAHAMRSGSYILNHALDAMQNAGKQLRVNVGLAIPDQDDMIYLDTLRFGPNASLRKVVSGQRVPIALTSLGRAYISTLRGQERRILMKQLKERHERDWAEIRPDIDRCIAEVHESGCCIASWQPQVIAISAPLVFSNDPTHVLNMSLFTQRSIEAVRADLAPELLRLRDIIVATVEQAG